MRSIAWCIAGAILLASSGCQSDRADVTALDQPLPPETAVLVASLADPPVGTEITVTARVTPIHDHNFIGSFSSILRYDTTAVIFEGEVPLEGGLRAVNGSEAGVVRVAGASADGFRDGRLFAVRLRVLRRGALSTLALAVPQLGGVTFGNRLGGLSVERAVRVSTR